MQTKPKSSIDLLSLGPLWWRDRKSFNLSLVASLPANKTQQDMCRFAFRTLSPNYDSTDEKLTKLQF